MLFRFSLYGFLKNQRYYEPFFLLFFLDRGFSFLLIGWLVAVREATVNLLEIPSGAIADQCGRRKSMVISVAAYIASFLTFAMAEQIWPFFLGMMLFAVGDAFRTGTHKAMIFSWLRRTGRESERTRVYGFTRSWSKFGSAVSALLASGFVLWTDDFSGIFLFATIPCLLNIVNLLSYPRELELAPGSTPPGGLLRHLWSTLRGSFRARSLRRLMFESMGFEGTFHAVKDYLQPVLMALAVLALSDLPGTSGLSDTQRTAVLVGPVYCGLFLLSGLASRKAHLVAGLFGGEWAAARICLLAALALFLTLTCAAWFELFWLLVICFVLLHGLQNIWRPILIARFDQHSEESRAATVLSVESQSRRVATLVLAPVVGLAVDTVRAAGGAGPFWPVGAVGALVILGLVLTARTKDASGGPVW